MLQLGRKGNHIVFNNRLISFKIIQAAKKIMLFLINSRQNKMSTFKSDLKTKIMQSSVQQTCASQDQEKDVSGQE